MSSLFVAGCSLVSEYTRVHFASAPAGVRVVFAFSGRCLSKHNRVPVNIKFLPLRLVTDEFRR